jgi:hypothetical protein
MAKRRYTTRQEDAAFILRRLAESRRTWQVGDRCLTYNLQGETTVARIDGEIVHLANGDHMHVTKMRGVN